MPDENTPTLGICVSNEDEPADSSTRLKNVGNNKNLDEEVTEVKYLLNSHLSKSESIPLMHNVLPLN